MPRPGFCGRIGIYLGEMFPVPRHLLSAALLAISFQVVLARLNTIRFAAASSVFPSAILSIFLLFLLLRLLDELKDLQIDRELFSDRPVPSGRVLESDIRFSVIPVSLAYLTVNCWSRITLAAATLVLAYALLMYRFFFIPGILRRYLLLNLVTHNPIIPLMFLQQTALLSASRGLKWSQLDWQATLLLIAAFWGMLMAWEIARKIRAPEEENEYVTYSQVLGLRGAVGAAFGVQTFTFVFLIHFIMDSDHGRGALGILIAGYLLLVWKYGRFLQKPRAVYSNLRGVAEQYILCVCSSLIAHWLFSLAARGRP
jgi:4-hydroxybenzoate polyprenyltransferase